MIQSKLNNLMTKIVFLLIIFALCLMTFSSCKCSNQNYSLVLESTVEIKSTSNESTGYGTGFVISEDGKILTCRHIVRYYDYQKKEYCLYDNIYVRFYNSEEFVEATVYKISEEYDLATLKIDGFDKKKALKIEKRNLSLGEEVYTIGNPNGFGLSFFGGYISSSKRFVEIDDRNIETIQLNIEVSDGNSGGPVLDENNIVIGIISFRLKDNKSQIINGLAYAIPSGTILDFIENN
ncbi:MAG: serine protease [Anaeroplasma sp.]|uniref:S1C family serine protease n=1 Tax=Anaeroplasma sp. TaxID=1872523 RepID=UPI002A910B0A|nr:serine protease [Anaeroplasma sp.]MDY5982279.1 serine protease [Anaeroplasma sp.]